MTTPHRQRPSRSLLILLAALIAGACGQKGPLYLPQDAQPAADASAGEEKPVEEEKKNRR